MGSTLPLRLSSGRHRANLQLFVFGLVLLSAAVPLAVACGQVFSLVDELDTVRHIWGIERANN